MAFQDEDINEIYTMDMGEATGSLGSILGGVTEGVNLGFDTGGPLRFTVQVSGGAQLMRNWHQVSDGLRRRAAVFTWEMSKGIYDQSREEVPMKTGRLRDCAYMEGIDYDPGTYLPRMYDIGYDLNRADSRGYPVAEEDYARRQHDDPSLHHRDGKKMHFLSDPFQQAEEKYPDGLSTDLREQVALECATLGVKKAAPTVVMPEVIKTAVTSTGKLSRLVKKK